MTYSFAKLQQAVALATRAHHGQLRKDNRTPYVSHPFRVAMVVCQVFGFHDVELLTAAVLHDAIEDTTTDYDDIIAAFGQNVAEWVRALSKDKRLPEAQREEEYVRGLVNAGWQVQVLKLADIFDNLSDLSQLPEDKQRLSLNRMRFYLDRMHPALAKEAKAAFDVVIEVLRATPTV
jgi:guanosine-3',5'-bis(diphosphate) 3'-pyrophosphohydrolase